MFNFVANNGISNVSNICIYFGCDCLGFCSTRTSIPLCYRCRFICLRYFGTTLALRPTQNPLERIKQRSRLYKINKKRLVLSNLFLFTLDAIRTGSPLLRYKYDDTFPMC